MEKKRGVRTEYPEHPSVDWSKIYYRDGSRHAMIAVECSVCKKVRHVRASLIAHYIRAGTFTGRCMKDRWEHHIKSNAEFPEAAGVNYAIWRWRERPAGRHREVEATCSVCHRSRWLVTSSIRMRVEQGTWTGKCTSCTRIFKLSTDDGRRTLPSGYIECSRALLPLHLIPYWDQMYKDGKQTLEHRVVACHMLGRMIRTNEVVHHRNGKRDDNRPENLQVFRRGQHHPGHGDHYHEVELLKGEVKALKADLKQAFKMLLNSPQTQST